MTRRFSKSFINIIFALLIFFALIALILCARGAESSGGLSINPTIPGMDPLPPRPFWIRYTVLVGLSLSLIICGVGYLRKTATLSGAISSALFGTIIYWAIGAVGFIPFLIYFGIENISCYRIRRFSCDISEGEIIPGKLDLNDALAGMLAGVVLSLISKILWGTCSPLLFLDAGVIGTFASGSFLVLINTRKLLIKKNGDRLFVPLSGLVWIVSSVAYYFTFSTFGTDPWLNVQPVIGALAATGVSFILLREILVRNKRSRFLLFFSTVSGGIICTLFPILALIVFSSLH